MTQAILALRSLIFVLWLVVTLVPYATVAIVVSFGLKGPRLYWFCQGWMRLAVWGAEKICGVRYRVTGLENLPQGAAILASKHQSAWETLAYPAISPKPLCFVFKREILFIPFFGWIIGRLDMIHIDRSKRAQAWAKVASQGRVLMDAGNWVIMFPEGTRIPRGQRGNYKTGASRLAVETQVPLVPMAVTSARCWPRKSFILRPGCIDVSIGHPLPPEGKTAEALMAEVEVWVEAEMHRLDPEAYPSAQPTKEALA